MMRKRKYAPRKRSSKRTKRTTLNPNRIKSMVLTSMAVPSGLPVKNVVKQRFVRTVNSTGVAGALNTQFHRMNGIFSIIVASNSGQPMGFDQMAALYDTYTVHYANAYTTFSLPTLATQAYRNIVCGSYIDDNAIQSYSSYQGLIEARKGTHAFMSNQKDTVSTKANVDVKKFFGVNDLEASNSSSSSVLNNPGNGVYLGTWFQSQDESSDVLSFIYTVVIDFWVHFREPKQIPRS